MINVARVCKTAFTYIRSCQADDGGFLGKTSPKTNDFTHAKSSSTNFMTALILGCLPDVPEAAEIRDQAAAFLMRQKSPDWTWNYWRRDSNDAVTYPYPDDLDDTACALAALSHYDPRLVDGTALGHFAKALITSEVRTGGPYKTWLIDTEKHPDGYDVDVAVNANIGFCLSQHDVTVPGLMQYIEEVITSHKLRSSYYPSRPAIIYFLSRWYRGEAITILANQLAEDLIEPRYEADPLMLALLISAACHLALPTHDIEPLVARLLELRQKDHWAASALYIDPTIQGVKHFAGAEALTTAFAIEALTLYDARSHPIQQTLLLPTTEPIMDRPLSIAADSRSLSHPELRKRYRIALEQLIKKDTDRQITGMASLVTQATQQTIPPNIIQHLNLASLHGWAAYSIYDDILDDEAKPQLLGVANLSLRKVLTHFQAALPEQAGFQTFVLHALEQVDGANTWEVIHARARLQSNGNVITISKLPDYGARLDPLWQRSWGHVLAACGVLSALGYEQTSREQQALQKFFQHYIIARQLNDDAHDWEADLSRGQLSAVVTMLLSASGKPYARLKLSEQLPSLRIFFWQQTIVEVCERISREIMSARQALMDCTALKEPRILTRLLEPLEAATTSALAERQETQKFMAAYTP